ncbi:MAG: hypothetical protein KGJ11_00240 [Candidatus Omnitrophica bacterium]|nr:hypothetical protein [Candidatus Omnitrophota bacterium]
MNKTAVFMSLTFSVVLGYFGMNTHAQVQYIKEGISQIEQKNDAMQQSLKDKVGIKRAAPVPLSKEYNLVMNQMRILEGYSGTSIDVQLDGIKDTSDIRSQFQNTEYKGVKGLMVKIVIDKYSKQTDMGAVLDDIYLLEKNTDFTTTQIIKDNNNLIVKGEIYGI